jgi:hypothetical protein
MVTTSYKESLRKIRTALLVDRLIREGNGLSSEEIEKVAKWNWYEHGGDTTPIDSLTMAIKMCQTVEEFAEAATLTRKGTEHEWAGENTFIEFGDWILGGGTFGFDKDLERTNGHNSSFEKENILPEFETTINNVILVKSEDKNDFNGRNDYEESWVIYILLKGGELKVDDKIKKIMEEFNI